MRKIKIIIGKASKGNFGSGKSFLMENMSMVYDESFFISGKSKEIDANFWLDGAENCDLIMIDDLKEKDFGKIVTHFLSPKIEINRQGNNSVLIDRPDIIITMDVDKCFIGSMDASTRRRCEFIIAEIRGKNHDKYFNFLKIG